MAITPRKSVVVRKLEAALAKATRLRTSLTGIKDATKKQQEQLVAARKVVRQTTKELEQQTAAAKAVSVKQRRSRVARSQIPDEIDSKGRKKPGPGPRKTTRKPEPRSGGRRGR